VGRRDVPPPTVSGCGHDVGGGGVHRAAYDGFPFYATRLLCTYSAFNWRDLQREFGWRYNLLEQPATIGCSFTYWYITRHCNEEQKWEIDRRLKLIPEEELKEHDVNAVLLGGGEIG
jgi:hypothetical protein